MVKKTEAEIAQAKEQRMFKLRFKAALVKAQLDGLSNTQFAELLFHEVEVLQQRNKVISGNLSNQKENK